MNSTSKAHHLRSLALIALLVAALGTACLAPSEPISAVNAEMSDFAVVNVARSINHRIIGVDGRVESTSSIRIPAGSHRIRFRTELKGPGQKFFPYFQSICEVALQAESGHVYRFEHEPVATLAEQSDLSGLRWTLYRADPRILSGSSEVENAEFQCAPSCNAVGSKGVPREFVSCSNHRARMFLQSECETHRPRDAARCFRVLLDEFIPVTLTSGEVIFYVPPPGLDRKDEARLAAWEECHLIQSSDKLDGCLARHGWKRPPSDSP
jgi:hypothetical protein